MAALSAARIISYGPAMYRNAFEVEDSQTVTRQMGFQRDERIVVQVLVVDHVVLQSMDHAAKIVDFEDEHAVRVEQLANTAGYVVDIGDMGVHVVGCDEIRAAVRVADLPRGLAAEEGIYDVNSFVVDRGDDIAGWIDSYDFAYTVVGKWLQQYAVVAADFDGSCVLLIEEAGCDLARVVPEVLP